MKAGELGFGADEAVEVDGATRTLNTRLSLGHWESWTWGTREPWVGYEQGRDGVNLGHKKTPLGQSGEQTEGMRLEAGGQARGWGRASGWL